MAHVIPQTVDSVLKRKQPGMSFLIDGTPARLEPDREQQSGDRAAFNVGGYPLKVIGAVTLDQGLQYMRRRVILKAEGAISARISQVRIIDLRRETPQPGLATLRTCTGGTCRLDSHTAFPPAMFQVSDHVLHGLEPFYQHDHTGRGSNEFLPLWLLEQGGEGLWFGPEWPGSWALEVHHLPEYTSILLEMPFLDFTMRAGEEIALPAITIGWFQGGLDAGCNAMRRVMRDRYIPDFRGEPPKPREFYHVFSGPREVLQESQVYDEAKAVAASGAETFITASDWQWDKIPGSKLSWWNLMGHYRPAPGRFPNGLQKLHQQLTDQGMELGLWIDPRVGLHCEAVNDPEIRDCLLFFDEVTWGQEAMKKYNPISYDINIQPLMDLSREEGRALFRDCLERIVTEFGARFIWFDLNADPNIFHLLPNQDPERKGLLELEYFQGLDTVMTQFLRDHPDVWVEMCASGGRMINLATLRMGHSHWITDYAEGDPDIGGAIRTGSNLFLPAVCSHQTYFPPRDLPENQPLPLYGIFAHFAGNFGLDSELKTLGEDRLNEIRAMVDFHREFAHIMRGDFFLLHPQATSRTDWEGWQFLSEDGRETLICARLYTASSLKSITITPHGGVDMSMEGSWELLTQLGDAEVSVLQDPITCQFGSERCVILHGKRT